MYVLLRFCSFEVCLDVKRGPLKTSVPKKTVHPDGISRVNLILAWNWLAKSTKLLISRLLEGRTEKSVINEPFLDDN